MKIPAAVATYFDTDVYKMLVEAGENGGWVPQLTIFDATGKSPEKLVLALSGGIPDLNRLLAIPQVKSKLEVFSYAAFAVMISEAWVSKNPSIRPSADPDRKTALVVSVYQISDQKVSLLRQMPFSYAQATEQLQRMG
jgi:hypothetical protein